ncbi:hypothetical protein DCO58_11790 [Helicobacter saguini]|uniref:Uncharacterized protein n=1 Tax=Helicobacter saguini TaxID=1548018 RepID=A0A347VQ94_9HELI|nr:hypothetical protein [Helicobacter saguini]MWV61029.1 hypothetical protein [Helicobacter saguini]MWV68302.1 hypothetical protein [Helicobacter saguini]MWV70233.1 hypothetical protein [Helicobacter saguini]MWV72136.1 hypothetical protein [Helicobacter saguini]TLD91637.1 hypothetical protein LS64_011645 [Helicobacter saguini]
MKNLNLHIHKDLDSNIDLDSIHKMLNRPSRYFLIENIESIGAKTLGALAFMDLFNGLVLYTTDNKISFKLCSFDSFLNELKAIPL